MYEQVMNPAMTAEDAILAQAIQEALIDSIVDQAVEEAAVESIIDEIEALATAVAVLKDDLTAEEVAVNVANYIGEILNS